MTAANVASNFGLCSLFDAADHAMGRELCVFNGINNNRVEKRMGNLVRE